LLSQEVEVEISKEQQEISMYAQKIISTVENAWMKPRNIPQRLGCKFKAEYYDHLAELQELI
jgi:hypothetical protein